MREIHEHIVHCSDSTFGDVAEIRRWHLERGWRDVGYHFVIRQDGEIEVGRQICEIGAHCKGFNTHSIGTCLIGVDDFTKAQFTSLRKLHLALVEMFPHIQLTGHCEHSAYKTCPNFDVHEVMRDA